MWESTVNDVFNGGYETGNANGAGGFMNSPSTANTPGDGAKKERPNQNIVASCIKSINDCEGESFNIEGTEVNMVHICGIIRNVDVSSSKTTYTIDDHSGVISVIKYAEDWENPDEEGVSEALAEGLYAKVIGPVRSTQGAKHVLGFRIEQINNPNQITTHILEVVHQKMRLKQINSGSGGNTSMFGGNTAELANSSLMKQPGAAGGGGGSETDLVVNAIKSVKSEIGANRTMIQQMLALKMSAEAVNRTIESLLSDGSIYTTQDDNHFMPIDN